SPTRRSSDLPGVLAARDGLRESLRPRPAPVGPSWGLRGSPWTQRRPAGTRARSSAGEVVSGIRPDEIAAGLVHGHLADAELTDARVGHVAPGLVGKPLDLVAVEGLGGDHAALRVAVLDLEHWGSSRGAGRPEPTARRCRSVRRAGSGWWTWSRPWRRCR